MIRDEAPGRPRGRSGALHLALLIAALAGGCDAVAGGSEIELDSGSVSVAGSVHEVEIGGAGAVDSIAPTRVEASPGDAVRFVVADRRPHALMFTVDALAPDVREYLESTGQLRGPPLVNEGSSWVILLSDAPPGRYPFYCRSHDAHGEVIVKSVD